MWLCLNSAFLSIVHKDCAEDELLIRARRKGDIEKVFADAKVMRSTDADYLYRAVVPRHQVATAMAAQIQGIDYGNFKSSVKDNSLHGAYVEVWHAMAALQSPPPYSASKLEDRANRFTWGPDDVETRHLEMARVDHADANYNCGGTSCLTGLNRSSESVARKSCKTAFI